MSRIKALVRPHLLAFDRVPGAPALSSPLAMGSILGLTLGLLMLARLALQRDRRLTTVRNLRLR